METPTVSTTITATIPLTEEIDGEGTSVVNRCTECLEVNVIQQKDCEKQQDEVDQTKKDQEKKGVSVKRPRDENDDVEDKDEGDKDNSKNERLRKREIINRLFYLSKMVISFYELKDELHLGVDQAYCKRCSHAVSYGDSWCPFCPNKDLELHMFRCKKCDNIITNPNLCKCPFCKIDPQSSSKLPQYGCQRDSPTRSRKLPYSPY